VEKYGTDGKATDGKKKNAAQNNAICMPDNYDKNKLTCS
jgi:hypothetical protein